MKSAGKIINANSVIMSDKHIFSEQILIFDYGKIKLNSFSSSVSAQVTQGGIANPTGEGGGIRKEQRYSLIFSPSYCTTCSAFFLQ